MGQFDWIGGHGRTEKMIMFRRITTLLLLTATLLSQWLCVNRCVGGCEAGGPENRPHVHLGAVLPGPPERSAGGCSCRHAATARPEPADDAQDGPGIPSAASGTVPDGEPDEGVLYLSFDSSVGLPPVGGAEGVGDEPLGLPALPQAADHRHAPVAIEPLPSPHPRPSRPLYLLTHSLLI